MKKYRSLIFYIITILGFSGIIYWVIRHGAKLENGKMKGFVPQLSASTWDQFKDAYHHNLTNPLAILLLQILTIITVARIFGWVCKKIRQPTVIGEIMAGIFLGPSFVGMYLPEFSAFLFPAKSLPNLQFLSQIGLILFMYVVGMELDLKFLRNKAKDAVVVSHASIIFPFTLGIGLAYYIYVNYAPDNIHFLSFSLFMGIAMSITAFPVLARIVQERGLSKTRLGTIVITCAAADDITAWCILAAVIAIVKAGSITSALFTILMAIAYVIVMLRVVRPFLKRMGEKYASKESISKPVVAIFFLTLLSSAYITEVIGIHALFGAFMAGVIMPARSNFRSIFIEKVEDVSLVLLLPLFFVFTGLRTQINLLNDGNMWWVCIAIILVAVVGKFVGSMVAARFVGQSWKDSLSIGALMNTRGLMELIVLNIGYDLGVLTPSIFAMMVIMALLTTFMTGPALDLINRIWPEKPVADVKDRTRIYSVLVTFRLPSKGVRLLRLASHFVQKSIRTSRVTALHFSPSNELNQYNQAEYERDNFEPIKEEAARLNLPVTTLFKASSSVEQDITQTANLASFNLLLIGAGSSVFEGSFLGKILGLTTRFINPEKLYDSLTGKGRLFENAPLDDTVLQILRNTSIPVGIYFDKGLETPQRIIVTFLDADDLFLLDHASQLMSNNDAELIMIDPSAVLGRNQDLTNRKRDLERKFPGKVIVQTDLEAHLPVNVHHDLMLLALESWRKSIDQSSEWLPLTPSVLVLKP
ncbi:MAG: cation:proton antiporter [Chitinophagaceae bacterium]